jgi:hypothetical protein
LREESRGTIKRIWESYKRTEGILGVEEAHETVIAKILRRR